MSGSSIPYGDAGRLRHRRLGVWFAFLRCFREQDGDPPVGRFFNTAASLPSGKVGSVGGVQVHCDKNVPGTHAGVERGAPSWTC